MDQDLGTVTQTAQVSVRISDRDRGDGAGLFGLKMPAVADRLAGRDLFDVNDTGLKGHGRADFEIRIRLRAALRHHAVSDKARSDHIHMHLRETDDPRAVADMLRRDRQPVLFELIDHSHETVILLHGVFVIIGIRHRKVREHTLDLDARKLGDRQDRLDGGFAFQETQTVHAGIVFNVDTRRSFQNDGFFRDRLGIFQRIDGLLDIVLDQFVDTSRIRMPEDQDRHIDAAFPKFQCFVEHGDGELVGAVFQEDSCRFDRSVSVSIGLNDRHDLRRALGDPSDLTHILRKDI